MARRPDRPAPQDPFDPLDGPVDRTVDLHGLRAAEARAHVAAVVESAHRKTPGALLHVITGRGRGSPGAPVLKGAIRSLLRSGQLRPVEAWAMDLDEGGYLVRLKGPRK
jgi:DNA-nicking Smr family endonuclease